MSTLDAPLNDLYDQLESLQRTVLGLERDYRALAERDDLAVDDLGDEMTPGECIARISESLAAVRRSISDAQTRHSEAKEAAARLFTVHRL
ncbi:hypothetical protein [Gordonia aquimaris]|uniref:Uncharacterized protein n=1 Tax=Gordonia aquimaris TaxID=2984863 RepID=A0A9X3I5V8_9ACTN|nr:hypothetical protein [Gordonia aquimaris]MCX2966208.1 hypothetical protein [Gordonia aquimaris]